MSAAEHGTALTMIVAGYIFESLLAIVALIGVGRAFRALQQGKRRKSLLLTYLSAWGFLFLAVFAWFFFLHWQRFSGVYLAVFGAVKACTTGIEYRWRKSIPDAEW